HGANDFIGIGASFHLGGKLRLDLGLGGVDRSVAGFLGGVLVGVAQFGLDEGEHFGFESRVILGLVVAGILGGQFGQLDDGLNDLAAFSMAEHHGAEHDLFAQFLGFRFHHQHGV